MNDSISILVAVFFILIALRWLLGGNQGNSNQSQHGRRRTTTNMPRRVQHRVTPQMIEMVRAMFPDIPTAAIQADLQRTGSVETTVDNALRDGGLPLPASMTNNQQGSASTNTNSPTTTTTTNTATGNNVRRKSPSHPNLVQRYKIDINNDMSKEPPKVWESSPDKRQEILRKRKEFMILQARK
ncbi:uncharacterized protein BX663DRAFT_497674 [Cokeromyces recurvatus]|uniref:uncharacterized protein n=1 Tax=Cokeromyces recurvatus TaxID=90255 RepID=UPI00221E48C7|nr:uncharacterized protein BX663DRAFT_497674 [Cokeromyces recurvatus]KAI7906816.1 hypothetical protein BX663DRAFT_497674 [Cokeromyces recurvatus]